MNKVAKQIVSEAVDLIVAFGLDDDRSDAAQNFRNGAEAANWAHWTWCVGRQIVTIDVNGTGKSVVVKVDTKSRKMSASDAASFAALVGRVADLAARIEALAT